MTGAHKISDRIHLGALRRYLSAKGWRHTSLPRGRDVFEIGSADDVIEIFLPTVTGAPDLSAQMAVALETLGAIEERPIDQVVSSIRSISFDLILSRLPDGAIRNDTIRLGAAQSFIQRMTRVLAAAAHSELKPSAYYARAYSKAQNFADECRFGHTFRGSFGFTIESPVGPNSFEVPEADSGALPFERRAVQRLARGLRDIEAAISEEDPQKIVGAYGHGLNANACDELAELVDEHHRGGVAFDIVFSPEWGFPKDIGARSSVSFGGERGVKVLRQASKDLRVVDIQRVRTIQGRVHQLSAKDNPSDLFQISGTRDMVVDWISDEFGRRNVRVSLEPEEYLQALEAHRQGREVSVEGELEQGTRWRLENPRKFRVI